tara:strand:+ start:1639 stop:2376 length:738 start_codon:yes stop_codon:yes gene_type:complete
MNSCVVIPARYTSSRFPGKPLVNILGKPMILRVAELAAQAVGNDNVYIATEDKRIVNLIKDSPYKSFITDKDALTGTDRIAEVIEYLDYEIIINVQGDEPILNPKDIEKAITLKKKYFDKIINGYCFLSKNENPDNKNLPKVITNEKNLMIYMSRSTIPGFKNDSQKNIKYKKQVCIYGFNKDDLTKFKNFGRKSYLESKEDIEILRFLELKKEILMFECSGSSLAVDVPEDVKIVEKFLKDENI